MEFPGCYSSPARKLSPKKNSWKSDDGRGSYARFSTLVSYLCSFCIGALIFLSLHPRFQRLRGPIVWDIFHGSLASHKCKNPCLTSDTLWVASATKVIDVLLKNKWSVGNIYMVISSLSVYLLENSVKFLFQFFLFYGVGLLISYPPKKLWESENGRGSYACFMTFVSYLCSFCIATLIFLEFTPTVTEVKRPDCVGYLPWFLG